MEKKLLTTVCFSFDILNKEAPYLKGSNLITVLPDDRLEENYWNVVYEQSNLVGKDSGLNSSFDYINVALSSSNLFQTYALCYYINIKYESLIIARVDLFGDPLFIEVEEETIDAVGVENLNKEDSLTVRLWDRIEFIPPSQTRCFYRNSKEVVQC